MKVPAPLPIMGMLADESLTVPQDRISVIIPTYKAPEALDICLRSALENQDNNKNQIIVVVDGFLDLNKHVLDKYVDHCYILDLETNKGLCKATNLGVYNATYEKILIVNDDNVFPPHWDTQLLEVYTDNRVIAPNQIEPSRSIFGEFVIHSLGDPSKFKMEEFNELANKLSKNEITPRGSTLPIFMNKQKYLMVGGWDESYPGAWAVDWDFFHKCDIAGLDLVRTKNCHFYHFVSYGTEATLKERKTKLGKEDACHVWFNYKWGFYPDKNAENYKICARRR